MSFPHRYNAAVDLVDSHLGQGRADSVAVRTPDARWTYAQVAAAVNRAGNVLRGLGVEIENRVFICLPDGIDAVTTFFGAVKIGAVPTLHAPGMPVSYYRHILEDSRAKVAVVAAGSAAAIREAAQGLPHLRRIVVAHPAASTEGDSLRAMMEEASANLEPADTSRDDIALFLYTSGTTGRPKAALQRHRSLRAGVDLLARHILKLEPGDSVLCAARMNMGFGLGAGVLLPFSCGATACLIPGPPSPSVLAAEVRRLRPTVFLGLSSSYAGMLAVPHMDFSSVRLCLTGGEPLSRGVYDEWLKVTGLDLIDALGSTEAMGVYLAQVPGDVRPGTLGRVVPGFEVRLVDEQGLDVAPTDPGEVLLKSESHLAGYWQDQDRTDSILVRGWVRTGDICRVDSEGRYTYLGRRDDMFKVGGFWVNPREIEVALEKHPLVQDVAAAPAGDAMSTWAAAYVVLVPGNDGHPELQRELTALARQHLSEHMRPRTIHFIAQIPRTPIGKVDRRALRELSLPRNSAEEASR